MKRFLVPLFAVVLLAAAAAPSLAAPAQRISLPDTTFQGFNPCTGNGTTFTLSNGVLVIHDDVDPSLNQHVAATITGDISTADGFSGRFNNRFGMNLRDISDPLIEGEFRGDSSSATLRDGSGRVIVLRAVFHVTVPSGPVGELKGSVDTFSLECVGKPS
jgi:hypothetical protein